MTNISFIKSLASSDISSHSLVVKEYYPYLTLSTIAKSFSPLNGGYPHNNIYKITPADQISHFSLCEFAKTSGAI